MYRRLLELNLILLLTGVVHAVRLGRRRRTPVAPISYASVAVVVALTILFSVCTWRIMLHPRFEVVSYNDASCYVLGRDDPRSLTLLHCPAAGARRNRIVPNADPRLGFTGESAELFEAYSRYLGN